MGYIDIDNKSISILFRAGNSSDNCTTRTKYYTGSYIPFTAQLVTGMSKYLGYLEGIGKCDTW